MLNFPDYLLKGKYLFVLLLVGVCLSAYPQAGKLFTVDLELSNSLIYDVFQDSKGIIWVATEDGLNRYDGSKFTTYKHDPKDSTSLLNNYVRLLFEDRQGNLLIGFYNGLQLYDRATETFRKIPLVVNEGKHFDAHVITITQRQEGQVLVGTSGYGVFALSFEGAVPGARPVQDKIPALVINLLFEDKDQNLWVFSEDKGLFRISQQGSTEHYAASKGIPPAAITGLCQDSEGNLYASSIKHGLFAYSNRANRFTPIPYPPLGNLPIASMYMGKKDELYLGTDGYGVKIYDLKKKIITDGSFNVTSFDFEKSKIHAILEDRAGNLWLGIYQKGVMLLPARASNFKYIGYKSIQHNTIGSNAVLAILEDHKGTRWIGTDSDGLYGINPNGSQKVHYSPSADPASVPATIMALYEDSDSTLWLGSYLKGLARLNRKTGKSEYVNLPLDQNGNKVERVYDLAEDRNKTLWIASMGAGLYSMELATQKVTHYSPSPTSGYSSDVNRLHNGWISSLLVTGRDKLYIGTYDGLGCLDLKTNSFTSTHGTNRLLRGHIVYSLHEDHKGNLWIGTSNGLIYLNTQTNEINTYTTEDGLPSNVVCAVKEDKSHNLWISTHYGISKLNPDSKRFINYFANDGLQGNEFSKGAAFVDQEGKLIFGGINGITYFAPEQIPEVISGPGSGLEVRITGFYLHNKAVKKGMKSGSYPIVETAVMDADHFHLSHQDNSFSLELSAMEFTRPERITYQYSLQKGEWISLRPGNNTVAFSDLAPGTYRFAFRAKDHSTYSKAREISILISPAWYFSSWAKGGYALALGLLSLLVLLQLRHRYRTRQKMQQHQQAKQINEARLQFFINIAHEIRTPLTLIINPLKRLMLKDNNPERQQSYTTMQRNSQRILHLINQLMDIQKIDQGQAKLRFQETELVGYLKGLCAIFNEQALSKHIALNFYPQQEELPLWIDPSHFDKIVLNVLSNAFKFTPEGGKIEIYLNSGVEEHAEKEPKQYAELKISDSGIGLAEHELERIFECFYQAKASQNHFAEGTGIGLHLTRSIVTLHHGSIRAENNPGGAGCSFIMRFPLGNDHLQASDIVETLPQQPQTKSSAEALPLPTQTAREAKLKPKTKSRILVVDDDEEIRRYLCQELAAHYHMSECSNGKEALAVVLQQAPDLIISDVMMPEMDGITFCRKVKQHPNINHVPVVLLTAKSGDEYTLEGLETGADAYLVKPFHLDILQKSIQNLIQNRTMLRNNFRGSQQQQDKLVPLVLKSADEKLMNKIMGLINQHMGNTTLSVEMIASEVGISRVHLHRKMKALTNQSTRDFIRNIRLQQAASLLTGKNQNISEVAFAVGFTSLATFSNAFKDFYGVPPTDYMENHLKAELVSRES